MANNRLKTSCAHPHTGAHMGARSVRCAGEREGVVRVTTYIKDMHAHSHPRTYTRTRAPVRARPILSPKWHSSPLFGQKEGKNGDESVTSDDW